MRLSFSGRQTAFLALIQGAIGFEWIKSGIEKATDSAYIPGMTKTIATFASKNPNAGFKSFLTGTVQPNAEGFGYVVMYGELLAGLGLIVGALVLLFKATRRVEVSALSLTAVAAVGSALMSFTFWQAAGWLSPSTDGINLMMGLVAVVIGAAAITTLVVGRTHQVTETPRVEVTGSVSQQLKHAMLHR